MNAQEFRSAAHELIEFVIDYVENVRKYPVLPSVEPGYLRQMLPKAAPYRRESWDEIMPDIERCIIPGMTHWHSPRFHAYFPSAQSYPSLLGDLLSGALGCVGFTWMASPACTELEMQMLDWLADMLGLPEHFKFSQSDHGGGVIHGTASEATLVALLAARARAQGDFRKELDENNNDSNESQSTPLERLVGYCSDLAHSSVERAGLLGGVQIKAVQSDDDCRMRGSALRAQILEDQAAGKVPFFVVATLGTTSVCTFDALDEVGQVCTEFGLWLHVDAAYAGNSFVCPENRVHMAGIEHADSFDVNPHKWLLVNFDCSTFYIRDSRLLVDAFNVDPIYLKHDKQGLVPDYRHWQIPLGRRFRSLKVWFVVRSLGVAGLQDYIRNHIKLAKYFERLVRADPRYEVTHPVSMGLVCFRLKTSNRDNELLVKRINEAKNIYLCPAFTKGKYIIRFAICAKSLTKEDVEYSWNEIRRIADQILIENNETEFKSLQLERAPTEVVKAIKAAENRVGSKKAVAQRLTRMDSDPVAKEIRFDDLKNAYTNVLEAAGEDITREGLMKTPERAAKALEFFMSGYRANINEVINGAIFEESYDSMLVVKDIDLYSLCEHHLIPFFGKVAIGYIPTGKILGLSKFAKIVEMFSRRLQVQERLTKQVAQAIVDAVAPAGVGVVIEARHMCMVMRGVEKVNSSTTTSCMMGAFRDDVKTREEFMSLVKGPSQMNTFI